MRQACAEPLRPWQKLGESPPRNTLMERPTSRRCSTISITRRPADAIEGIARTVSAGEPLYGRTFVAATAAAAGLGQDSAGDSSAPVRMELGGWDEADVQGFVTAALERVGGDPQSNT